MIFHFSQADLVLLQHSLSEKSVERHTTTGEVSEKTQGSVCIRRIGVLQKPRCVPWQLNSLFTYGTRSAKRQNSVRILVQCTCKRPHRRLHEFIIVRNDTDVLSR